MKSEEPNNKEINKTAQLVGKTLKVLYNHPWSTVNDIVKIINTKSNEKVNYKQISRILRGLNQRVLYSQ